MIKDNLFLFTTIKLYMLLKCRKKLGINFYFVDSYSDLKKGTNENSNYILRRFYPKKTDLSLVKDEDLISLLIKINARPSKYLAFNAAFEEFLYKVNNLDQVCNIYCNLAA